MINEVKPQILLPNYLLSKEKPKKTIKQNNTLQCNAM